VIGKTVLEPSILTIFCCAKTDVAASAAAAAMGQSLMGSPVECGLQAAGYAGGITDL
jgi:hypothetical protein